MAGLVTCCGRGRTVPRAAKITRWELVAYKAVAPAVLSSLKTLLLVGGRKRFTGLLHWRSAARGDTVVEHSEPAVTGRMCLENL